MSTLSHIQSVIQLARPAGMKAEMLLLHITCTTEKLQRRWSTHAFELRQ